MSFYILYHKEFLNMTFCDYVNLILSLDNMNNTAFSVYLYMFA